MATASEDGAKKHEGRGCIHMPQGSTCIRCGGFMVAELCMDLSSTARVEGAVRCVQCGEVVDPVILQNRHLQRTQVSFTGESVRSM